MCSGRESARLSVLIAELKACTSSRNLHRGRSIHKAAIQSGDASNVYIASTLINMYVKCGCLNEARQVFHGMRTRTAVSWNALILGHADNGEDEAALDLLSRMDCAPTERTLVAALKACAHLATTENTSCSRERGKALHLLASSCGCDSDPYVESSLVDMYAKCGSMQNAHKVFDSIRHLDVVAWNALILGYADNGEGETALALFAKMSFQSCAPDARTLVTALRVCADLASDERLGLRERGRALHLLALRSDSDIYVGNTLVDMYAKFGSMKDARRVFDSLQQPNVVTWTSIIMGYAEDGEGEQALSLFHRMLSESCQPNTRTFVSCLKACTVLAQREEPNDRNVREASLQRGGALHLLASRSSYDSDKYVGNTLVDMYAKCGSMECASRVFEEMRYRDVVSWTGLIMGYADNGEGRVALDVFSRMKREGCEPNSTTFVAVLKACGILGALELGRGFHADVHSRGFECDAVVATCLVDFYSKCGSLVEAEVAFASHPKRDLVTWTALMAGYSRHGDTEGIFGLFDRMQDSGVKPDEVTFKCILTSCSHAGLVDKGKECFEVMCTRYGSRPDLDHYNCMFDLLGRGNRLDEAMALFRSMAVSSNVVTWMTLLGACRKWKYLRLGSMAFECLKCLDSANVAAYVLMANICGSRGMFQDQEKLQAMRKKLGFWKTPGQSWWTNRTGVVHTFLAGDKNHPQSREIEEKMKELVVKLREHGYVADLSSVTGNLSDPEKEAVLCGHSERLAICCALVNTEPGETLRIMKNLRVCEDCHGVTALISKLEKRTIVCRDASRFHVFKDGECSCCGFW